MEYTQAKYLISSFAGHIKRLSIVCAVLGVCILALIILLWTNSSNTKIVLVPTSLHEKASISEKNVSSSYLEAMAIMLVGQRLNVTPDTVEKSNMSILEFVDSGHYASYKTQLLKDIKIIQSDSISSTFYINNIQADPKKLTVKVSGRLKRWVGERLIGVTEKSYELSFVRRSYLLLLSKFQEMHTIKEEDE